MRLIGLKYAVDADEVKEDNGTGSFLPLSGSILEYTVREFMWIAACQVWEGGVCVRWSGVCLCVHCSTSFHRSVVS